MELRHLRYFIAVAEEGSLTLAAGKRLHTAQPSLSRQIRDLEYEVGVQLMSRSVHGIELTAAGRAFLDHARLALMQVDAAHAAAHQLDADLVFEIADLAAKGRLCRMQPSLSRERQAALLGDRDEIAKVP